MSENFPTPKQAAESFTLDKIIEELQVSYDNSTKGTWKKGKTTHHTETESGYRIAEFHHAKDANFVDISHAFMPRIISELKKLIELNQKVPAS